MSEQQKNGYEDSDLKQIIEEIEGYEAKKATIMATAAGECSQLARKIADAKKTAKALNIPRGPLTALLKSRKLQRKLDEIAKDVDEDYVEVFEDMLGQFSFLAPVDGEDEDEEEPPPAKKPRKTAAAEAVEAAEQAEGEKVLESAAVH